MELRGWYRFAPMLRTPSPWDSSVERGGECLPTKAADAVGNVRSRAHPAHPAGLQTAPVDTRTRASTTSWGVVDLMEEHAAGDTTFARPARTAAGLDRRFAA